MVILYALDRFHGVKEQFNRGSYRHQPCDAGGEFNADKRARQPCEKHGL